MSRVRVPASIANLGPGFDVLALAVDLWLEVDAVPSDVPGWEFEGEGAELLRRVPNPLSSLPMRGRVRSQIPVGVGLGSSAAARVAALALQGVPEAGLLTAAAEEEGHGDNAAAAVLGGLVLVTGGRAYGLPTPELEVALFVADHAVPTEHARALLAADVPRADAVHNAGRLGLLVHALHQRDWTLLDDAFQDRLHQPQRAAIYPWLPSVLDRARAAGAHGAFLAGAGPSVAAFCTPGAGMAVAESMARSIPIPGRPLSTWPSISGMTAA